VKQYLFFSDIDGTLLRENSGIHPAVKSAVKRFIKAGGLLSLCTGRSHISSDWVAKELGISVPCILFAGAALYDFSLCTSIWTRPLDHALLECAQEVCEHFPSVSVQVYTQDEVFILQMNERLKAHGVKEELVGQTVPVTRVKGDILKLVMACDDVDLLQACGEKIFIARGYRFAFASTHFAEVVASGAGKDRAMHKLVKHYRINPQNTFGAGDGMTDLPMLKASSFSFAPANAMPAVLAACDQIIPACEEGGMAVAFELALARMQK